MSLKYIEFIWLGNLLLMRRCVWNAYSIIILADNCRCGVICHCGMSRGHFCILGTTLSRVFWQLTTPLLTITFCWFAHDLRMILICVWFVCDLVWFACDLRVICVWSVFDLCVICVWFVFDLCVICVWFAYDLRMICVLFAYDLRMIRVWFACLCIVYNDLLQRLGDVWPVVGIKKMVTTDIAKVAHSLWNVTMVEDVWWSSLVLTWGTLWNTYGQSWSKDVSWMHLPPVMLKVSGLCIDNYILKCNYCDRILFYKSKMSKIDCFQRYELCLCLW